MPIAIEDLCLVHIGIDRSQVMEVVVHLRECGHATPVVEGDGWLVWGETAGSLADDADSFHVQVPTPNPQRAVVQLLAAGFTLHELGPEGSASRRGTIAVITDPTSDDDDGLEVTRADVARNLAGFRRPGRRAPGRPYPHPTDRRRY